jgi:hypothetical protein
MLVPAGGLRRFATLFAAVAVLLKRAKGEGAAFADFKRGFALAFPDVKLPPKMVFDEIIKHCG